ncbi:MAG: hypothetical protein HYV07_29955 [Deltaproteobacteria bacterium]|nr:hypothetical protein [Deltaproteobacteria bacterium]
MQGSVGRAGVSSEAVARWLTKHDPAGLTKLGGGEKLAPETLRALETALGAATSDVRQALESLELQLGPEAKSGRSGFSTYGSRSAAQPGAASAPIGAALGRFRFQGFDPKLEARLDSLTGGHKLAGQFPAPEDPARSLAELKADLRDVPVRLPNGKVGDVFSKLSADKSLSKAQKDRIFAALAEVRDNYMRLEDAIAPGEKNKGYQVVNWKHTRGEIDQVLEASKLAKLSPRETEDALLASIFSDAVKTPQNFITHNVDGAFAAAEVLSRHFDPKRDLARIEGIVAAVKEHQIGPPAFMSMILTGMLRGKLGKDATPTELALVTSIGKKVANPFDEANLTTDKSKIAFSGAELEKLALVGVKEWNVPHQGSSHYGASRAVIDGDSLINYASPDGWAKIVAIRGPETGPFFEDKTVFDSAGSAMQSYNDATSVMSDAAKPLAKQGLARTQTALDRVKTKMEAFFASKGDSIPKNSDGTIAFWNAPLKYPKPDAPLSAREQQQLSFAKQIREEVVRLLRAEQGTYS